ncbi:DUF4279 domain-containing protein [Streptomyces atratus]|uniref:DUF4279 domain-containing protein n=1 Tax=Streptomyces atratus TaxID=1893 RepID=UPI0022543570|nr:DUF4279 domain-containing protein [Streptomyces atratus]MCX5340793.1 DUF4279 domain-containing protein [Streptomyces atratus]
MYVRVISKTLQPGEIDVRLGVCADESYALGSRKHPQSRPFGHTGWKRHAVAPEPGARPEDLEPIALGWGEQFARSLGALTDSGDAEVALVLVQSVEDLDDEMSKGIVLSARLVAWLAIARAYVDIDQYIFHACEERATEK